MEAFDALTEAMVDWRVVSAAVSDAEALAEGWRRL